MIISRTPFRISFLGGGTDLPDYYRHDFGAVVSTTIQKYVYVMMNERFDGKIRVSHSETEKVDHVEDIKHDLVREVLKMAGIERGVEIAIISDIPERGTGLGSSSSLTIGLLNALYAFQEKLKSPEDLAKEACKIEIEILREPIGKQDQYAAAYGGLNYIRFNADETVLVDPIVISKQTKQELEDNIMLFYTGITRRSRIILKEQKENIPERLKILDQMREQAIKVRKYLAKGNLSEFGTTLHEGWLLKKRLASGITIDIIDKQYEAARRAGARGGKICGAGGGGFLLLYCEKERQGDVRKVLGTLREVDFKIEPQGSKIIYPERWK